MLITTLCDWFAFSASASDFYIPVFHIIISEGVVESSAESERCFRRKSCISKPRTHTGRPHYEKLLRFSELTVSKLFITKKFRLVKVLWKVFHFFFSLLSNSYPLSVRLVYTCDFWLFISINYFKRISTEFCFIRIHHLFFDGKTKVTFMEQQSSLVYTWINDNNTIYPIRHLA